MARLSIIVVIGIALMCTYAQETLYSNQYDDIAMDVADILNNEKARLEYYNCFLDAESCVTDAAKFFRGVIFEAIRTDCKKCNEKQKQLFKYLKDWYIKNMPDQWQILVTKSTQV